ncbi:DNA replication terminus site-binding protein [Pantoea sp. 1.19]|uniref:DNA replication terminus site-binding protein n=1 Tax=Pantoea sp. 1.19 TaxID=1925589 RepID=UPI000948E1B1|nr:DNA replication terminus site-binding protein [Pantoea sp. 1.19]
MDSTTLVPRLHETVNALELHLQQLCQQLATLPAIAARVFTLPAVEKGQEHEAISHIAVGQQLGEQARRLALAHYPRLFMQHQSEKISTKAAVRLPGVLCLRVRDEEQLGALLQQIEHINQLKQRLEQLITVETGLPSDARFEFVHRHLPGLITLNAYRGLTALQQVDSVRFGWANKHIIKNVSREEVAAQLEKSLRAGRAVAPWTREQWAEKVQEELRLITRLPSGVGLKIKRPVKVQPIARVWRSATQKQTQLACPSPLLVFCLPHAQVPDIGELLNYDADNVRHRHKPAAAPLSLLIPRLHLYSHPV